MGLDGLAAIGRHFSRRPAARRNVWLETSASVGMAELSAWDGHQYTPAPCSALEPFRAAWRAFGIDYVLYGSDFTTKGFIEERRRFEDCPSFARIMEPIMRRNAKGLLDRLDVGASGSTAVETPWF